MKQAFLIFIISSFSNIANAQSERTFTIPQIGWSFVPPTNFTLLDSSAENYKLSEKITIWKRNLFFKDYSDMANTIACSISTGSKDEEQWNQTRPRETESSYRALTNKYSHLSFDSSTTTLTIDGISFQRFSMVGKENGIVKYNHIQLAKFYKGYKVNLVYMFENPIKGLEIEKQILESKFSK